MKNEAFTVTAGDNVTYSAMVVNRSMAEQKIIFSKEEMAKAIGITNEVYEAGDTMFATCFMAGVRATLEKLGHIIKD